MVEFRTEAPGQSPDTEGGSGFNLEKHLEKVINNVKNDPELKANLLQNAVESDIDPTLIRAIDPEAAELIENARQKQQAQSQGETPQPRQTADAQAQEQEVKTVTETVMKEPTAEEVKSIIEEVIDTHPKGEDATLGELLEFVNGNEDTVEIMIENAW